jgi:glycosyltransferase involved in cell wall biosynthesis
MATNILFDSLSQIKFTEKYFGKYKKFHVINHGSINGVNTNIFKPSPQKNYLRKKLKIKKNDIVLIYAGRLNKDKGIEKLIEVFLYLEKSFRNLKLILVGIDEDNLKYKFKSLENIYIFKHQEKLANFFQLSDIFCSFSSREGFGVSIIQASASCLPIFCSDIYGFKDSIKNNYTGIKFNTRSNKITISKKLSILINKKSLRVKFGRQGRNYVKKYFEQEKVINHYNKYFKNLLK